MSHKDLLIASIENSLQTIAGGNHQDDPVIKTMSGRITSLNVSLKSARGIAEHEILGALTGMEKQSSDLLARYLSRADQIEQQKFSWTERWFRKAEVFLLVASTLGAIWIGNKSLAVSRRQADIMEAQLKAQADQDLLQKTFVSRDEYVKGNLETQRLLESLKAARKDNGK